MECRTSCPWVFHGTSGSVWCWISTSTHSWLAGALSLINHRGLHQGWSTAAKWRYCEILCTHSCGSWKTAHYKILSTHCCEGCKETMLSNTFYLTVKATTADTTVKFLLNLCETREKQQWNSELCTMQILQMQLWNTSDTFVKAAKQHNCHCEIFSMHFWSLQNNCEILYFCEGRSPTQLEKHTHTHTHTLSAHLSNL